MHEFMSQSLTSPSGSGILNSAATREDFPDPVRPVIPTFSLFLISTVISLRTRWFPSTYLKDKFLRQRLPLAGRRSSFISYPGSGLIWVKVITRSTDVIKFSVSDVSWTPNWAASKVSRAYVSDIPAIAVWQNEERDTRLKRFYNRRHIVL